MEEREPFHDDGPTSAEESSPLLLERLHRALAQWNERRLRAEQPTRRWREEIEDDLRMRSLEGEWIEAERAALARWTRGLPRTSAEFLRWFEALVLDSDQDGDTTPDPPAGRLTLDEVRWWMRQELAASSGLEALAALLPLRLPDLPQVARLAAGRERLLAIGRRAGVESGGLQAVWESLAVANLDVAFALSRRYAWHAVGALGAAAMTAADRTERLAAALRRLGFDVDGVDLPGEKAETAGLLRAALVPSVDEKPERIPWLAEGALLRLRAGLRAARRYRSALEFSEPVPDATGSSTRPSSR